jgi:hypothetical protein
MLALKKISQPTFIYMQLKNKRLKLTSKNATTCSNLSQMNFTGLTAFLATFLLSNMSKWKKSGAEALMAELIFSLSLPNPKGLAL